MSTAKQNRPSRRYILQGLAAGTSSLALGGCNILDDLTNEEHWLRNFMERANDLTYGAQRLLLSRTALAKEFPPEAIMQPQRANGVINPPEEIYRTLANGGFANYRLKVGGHVENSIAYDLETLRRLPSRTQITRHDCVEGWSSIAQWTGVRFSEIVKQVRPTEKAKYVLFTCFDERGRGARNAYYETIDLVDAMHEQTILAYGMNGRDLPIANGAPLRLRVERQLGYKMAKYIRSITFVDSFADVGLGHGGYWEDRGYDWYAGI